MSGHRPRGFYVGGVILVVLGVLFLLDNLGLFRWMRLDTLWPLILIAIGLVLIFSPRGR